MGAGTPGVDVRRLDLDATHPSYEADLHAQRRALYHGGSAWRALLDTWLPQREAEPEAQHKVRKKVATYTNDAGPLIGMVPGFLLSKPLTAEAQGGAGEWWSTWMTSVDRRGTGLSEAATETLLNGLVDGVMYTWVNLPRRDGEAANRADEEQRGYLDAYLVQIPGAQVIRWEDDERGGLAWLVVRDERLENVFGQASRRLIRWTYIDAELVRIYEAADDTAEEAGVSVAAEVAHNMGRVPVVRTRLRSDLHAMEVLRDPATALVRARNGRQWAVERTAYALLVLSVDGNVDGLRGGEGWFIKLPKDARAEYIEPSGASLQVLDAEITRCRDDLFRQMRALMLGTHSDALQQQSGESKARDWQGFDATLSEYARLLKGHFGEVLAVVAAARRETVTWTMGGLDGWQSPSLDEVAVIGALAGELFRRSPTTHVDFLIDLAVRLFGDKIKPDDLRKEIEAYDPATDPALMGGMGAGLRRPASPAGGRDRQADGRPGVGDPGRPGPGAR